MKKQNGITLIALIITIIVMLILVGVTINVALNGGLFDKAKTATIQTEISQIQEQLVLAKAEKIADNNGYVPTNYGIALSDLDLSDSIKEKYANKLTVSKDGTLYYTENATANDIVYFENSGITKYEGTQAVDNLIPTESELGNTKEYGNGYAFAEGENSALLYNLDKTALVCNIGNDIYIWFTSEEVAVSSGATAFTWYFADANGTEQMSPPINASSFSTVYSESYLTRVLASL